MRKLLLALLCACVAPGAVYAQADVLTGRVTDVDGQPVVGAQVEALSLEMETTRTVLSDARGRYLIVFPDGGGRYHVRVTFIGMGDALLAVVREADEDLLVRDITLSPRAIQLESITVRGRIAEPGRGGAGQRSTAVGRDILGRLPLLDLEPGMLAILTAGVVPTRLDTLTGSRGYSVAGMSDELNQVRLDRSVLGAAGPLPPDEGIRRVEFTSSSFDVARGGFAGGQVTVSSARGSNRRAGALNYGLDDNALQQRPSPTTSAYTRHNLGGSYGGPLRENRLFYHASFQLTRNTNHRFALAADDPLAAQRSGVSADSVARFLSIMGDGYGFPVDGTGRYSQLGGELRLQARMDWNVIQTTAQAHTLTLLLSGNFNHQDSTRINALDLAHHGGVTERDSRHAALTLSSRLGGRWTNTLDVSWTESWDDASAFIVLPEGQVRVTSEFDDGTRGTRSLVFGGNRNMPSEAHIRDVQVADEVSLLLPVGRHLHRLRLGGSIQHAREVSRATDNMLGSFVFSSLADLESNRPDRYERSLNAREASIGRYNIGLFLGDSWRVSAPLELTFGVRWDRSSLVEQPGYNPAVETAFGRRTDGVPGAAMLSPRIGFNYNLAQPRQPARSISGGIGVFTGRPPTSIFTAAMRQTGLPDADQRLSCVGDATPTPDWLRYLGDPGTVPTACADGGAGAPPSLSSRAPTITLLAPEQSLPASIRFEIGYRTSLLRDLSGTFRYTYAYGIGLWGYRDLNLDESRTFEVGGEGRPFFGDPAAIVERSGAVTLRSSRRDPAFGSVFDVTSSRRSISHQFTSQVSGRLHPRLTISGSHTLGFTRDDGSGSFSMIPIAGSPNAVEWATASTDRRHSGSLTSVFTVTPRFELTAIARLASGTPFTPIVNRDINGDGARNDRAFVFDPEAVTDTLVANGMRRLLDVVPGRVRSCLRASLGGIAPRNACRESWTQSLDLRANLRPVLPGVASRMTLAIDARNVLTGVDFLLHGADGLKGWGEGQRSEPNLLVVRSFDHETRAFRYEVNEEFGQARRGPNAVRAAFALAITARVTLGPPAPGR